MKRFTETTKWTNNKWFFELSIESKLFWIYLLDSCDSVGVWEENIVLSNRIIGYEYSIDTLLKDFGKQIYLFKDNRKWWIKDFCKFQYGELLETSNSKPHQSYINVLKNHGLWKEYLKGIDTLKEKEKEKETELDKVNENTIYSENDFSLLPEKDQYKLSVLKLTHIRDNCEMWQDRTAMNLNISKETFKKKFIEFGKDIQARKDFNKSIPDIQNHFVNWLKKNK